MFIAAVWSCLLPSVEHKNDLNVFKPNEKSWLLRGSEKNIRKLDNNIRGTWYSLLL